MSQPATSRPTKAKAGKLTDSAGSTPFGQVSFSSNMLYWTRLLETSYNRAFVAEVPKSISVSVWRVLAWLSEKKTLTVGELSLHTHMERTTLGRLLDRMAKQGLIERTSNRGDRRISMTRIATKGRRAFTQMQPLRDAIYEKAIRNIDTAEIETARRVVVRMVMNLSATDTGDDTRAAAKTSATTRPLARQKRCR